VNGRPRAALWLSLLAVVALVLPFCVLGLHSGDSDTYYHLAAGRWMAETGRVLDHETFSFTVPGRPWTNYYWGFERLLFAAYEGGGLPGILVLRALLMLGTASLFVAWVHRRTAGALLETLAFSLLFVAIAVPRSLNVRPHLVSYLLMVVALFLLDAFQAGRRRAAGIGLVALCVVLANAHGVQYPVVLLMITIYAAGGLAPHLRRPAADVARDGHVRGWAALVVGCAAAFLVNPFGVRLLATPAIGANAEVMAQIAEMQPLPLTAPILPPLSLVGSATSLVQMAALAGLVLLPGWIRRRELLPAAFFILGLGLALHKQRFIVEFLLLAVPFVAAGVARLGAAASPFRRPIRAALVVLSAFIVLSAVASARGYARDGGLRLENNAALPVGPVDFFEREGLGGRLVCDPTVSGYVTWRLFPRVRVLADMRAPEPFGSQEMWLSRAVGGGLTQWDGDGRLPVDLVVASRGSALAASLQRDAQGAFVAVYADPWYVAFAHRRVLGGRALGLGTLAFMEQLEADPAAVEQTPPAGLRAEAERLVAVAPANTLAQRALLFMLLAEGRLPEVVARARELERSQPRQETYPFYRGLAAARLGDTAQAVEAFRLSLDRNPAFVAARPPLAEALLVLGRSHDALEVMEAHAWGRWAAPRSA
jgi:hypothetical protein